MLPNKLYRHISTLDTRLLVIRVLPKGDHALSVKGKLVHARNGLVYETIYFDILKSELWKWKLVEEQHDIPPEFEKTFQDNWSQILA